MIPLITIEGATASGKTAFAIALAQLLQTGIISADSRQVYRYLDIGTAKPSREELSAISHHLIGIIDPDQNYSAGRFVKDATPIINELHNQSKIPIVCGGTGLYIRALLHGLFELDIDTCRIKQDLIRRLEHEPLEMLYSELLTIDPVFAAQISPNDRQRIIRGLEVWGATGVPLSLHWRRQQEKETYRCFRILIEPGRKQLYDRINARVTQMVKQGLVDEMRTLIDRGFDTRSPGLNTLGYKELMPFFRDSVPLETCLDLIRQHTRNYAKRQLTWYRKANFHLTLTSPEFTLSDVTAALRSFFNV